MRSILLIGTFYGTEMAWALGLNAVYAAFCLFLRSARVGGSLLQLGE